MVHVMLEVLKSATRPLRPASEPLQRHISGSAYREQFRSGLCCAMAHLQPLQKLELLLREAGEHANGAVDGAK